jgi:hypothetical protein
MNNQQNKSFLKLLLVVFSFFTFLACQKEDGLKNDVVISTLEVSNNTLISAESGGIISSQGSSPITVRGVCWSKFNNPTIDNDKTIDSQGTGSYKSYISGLALNSTYYLRAYAINSSGVFYGNLVKFNTPAVAPCSPTKNSITYNGQKQSLFGVYFDSTEVIFGKYEISAASLESSINITFNVRPENGVYLIDGDRDPDYNECSVSGVFGGTFSYYYSGNVGDSVYVYKIKENKYMVSFCKVKFTSSSTTFKFTTDGNLTME